MVDTKDVTNPRCAAYNPYIHISSTDVPVSEKLRERLKERLRKYGFHSVIGNPTSGGPVSGYIVVFPDSPEGLAAITRCYKSCNGTPFGGYSLRMRKFDSGFPMQLIEPMKYLNRIKRMEAEKKDTVEPTKMALFTDHPKGSSLTKMSRLEVRDVKTTRDLHHTASATEAVYQRGSSGARESLASSQRRLDEDDNKSSSSTSSLKRSGRCYVCNQADGLSYNPLVTCHCHRRFHSTCHKPAVTLAEQSSGTWRCYICTMRRQSRTMQPPSVSSLLQPPLKRRKLQSPTDYDVDISTNNGKSLVPRAGTAYDTSRSDNTCEGLSTGTYLNGVGASSQQPLLNDNKSKPESHHLLPSSSVVPLKSDRSSKLSKQTLHDDMVSSLVSMGVPKDKDHPGNPEIRCEGPSNPTMALHADPAGMGISSGYVEPTKHRMLSKSLTGVERMAPAPKASGHNDETIDSLVKQPGLSNERYRGAIDFYNATAIVRPSVVGPPKISTQTWEEKISNILNFKQCLPIVSKLGEVLIPPPPVDNSLLSSFSDTKDGLSDTPMSEAIKLVTPSRSTPSSCSELSSPPSEVGQPDTPTASTEKPKGSYITYITAALREAPTGYMSSLDICNSIIQTYPYYAQSFPRNTLTTSVSATLSQRPEFIKNARPPDDLRKGSLWSLNQTARQHNTSNEAQTLSSGPTSFSSARSLKPKSTPEIPNLLGKLQSHNGATHDTITTVRAEYAIRENGTSSVHIAIPMRRHGGLPPWSDLEMLNSVPQDENTYRVGDTVCVLTHHGHESAKAYGLIREIRRFAKDQVILAILWYFTKYEMVKANSSKKHQNEWPEGCRYVLTNWLELVLSKTVVGKVKGPSLATFYSSNKILDVKVGRARFRDASAKEVSWTLAFHQSIGSTAREQASTKPNNIRSSQDATDTSANIAELQARTSTIEGRPASENDPEEAEGLKEDPISTRSTATCLKPGSTTEPIKLRLEPARPTRASPSSTPARNNMALDNKKAEIEDSQYSHSNTIGRKRPLSYSDADDVSMLDIKYDASEGLSKHSPSGPQSSSVEPGYSGPIHTNQEDAMDIVPLDEHISSESLSAKSSEEQLLREVKKLKLDKQSILETALNWDRTASREAPLFKRTLPADIVYNAPPPNAAHLKSQKKATFGKHLSALQFTERPLNHLKRLQVGVTSSDDDARPKQARSQLHDIFKIPEVLTPVLHEGKLAFRGKFEASGEESVYVLQPDPDTKEENDEKSWQFLGSTRMQ